MPFGYIYRTKNLLCSTYYIGQSHGDFKPAYFGSGLYLVRALKKHGKHNFLVEALAYGNDQKELDDLEKHHIKTHRYLGSKLYNIADGGRSHGPHSEEAKLKMSKAKLAYKWPNGRKAWNTGKKLTPEHKEKIRLANLGRKWSDEARRKFILARTGVKLSEAHKLALKKIQNNRSPEWKAKMGFPRGKKKKPFTDLHKQRIKEAWARRKLREQELLHQND